MKHSSSGPIQFLRRPPHSKNESLRGYISRVASANGSSRQLEPVLRTLKATTNAIQEFATLAGCDMSLLKSSGSLAQVGVDKQSGVRFGSGCISTNRVRLGRRVVCPRCLLKNGISTCCWDLRDYDVCHEHGCYLVARCTACDRFLIWSTTSSYICPCGKRYADMQTEMAPVNRRLICEFMSDAMQATTAQSTQEEGNLESLTPIHLFFSVGNFVRSILIPSIRSTHFGRSFIIPDRLYSSDLNFWWPERIYEAVNLVIFNNREYYSHLSQVIALHAVGNPISMVQRMTEGFVEGFLEKKIKKSFKPCIGKVSVDFNLFNSIANVISDTPLRSEPNVRIIKRIC